MKYGESLKQQRAGIYVLSEIKEEASLLLIPGLLRKSGLSRGHRKEEKQSDKRLPA